MNENLKVKRGDVVWVENSLASENVQKGTRPYLILSNNLCNIHSNILTAIPFTSKVNKKDIPTHHRLNIYGTQNIALCEQLTTITKSSILKYICTINDYDLQQIEEKVKIQMGIGDKK
jgi:mRNA interferase MazF